MTGTGTAASLPADHPLASWPVGPDGVPHREAARVVLLDPLGRVLLVRGHDGDDPDRTWWFTVGGGIEDGEDARTAAARELTEETGLAVAPEQLAGPVLTRSATFDFFALTVRQSEVFYVHHLDCVVEPHELHREGWTAGEHDLLDELAWWSPQELGAVEIEVFPTELAQVVAWLAPGWDGTVRHLGHTVGARRPEGQPGPDALDR